MTKIFTQGLAGSESSSETGLNRPITEDDSLQISGRGPIMSFAPHGFDSIAEAPENIPKVTKLSHLKAWSGIAVTALFGAPLEKYKGCHYNRGEQPHYSRTAAGYRCR